MTHTRTFNQTHTMTLQELQAEADKAKAAYGRAKSFYAFMLKRHNRPSWLLWLLRQTRPTPMLVLKAMLDKQIAEVALMDALNALLAAEKDKLYQNRPN